MRRWYFQNMNKMGTKAGQSRLRVCIALNFHHKQNQALEVCDCLAQGLYELAHLVAISQAVACTLCRQESSRSQKMLNLRLKKPLIFHLPRYISHIEHVILYDVTIPGGTPTSSGMTQARRSALHVVRQHLSHVSHINLISLCSFITGVLKASKVPASLLRCGSTGSSIESLLEHH